MKKSLIITSSSILFTVILAESGVFNALTMFVLMGQIPGTNYSIPASTMLALVSATAGLIVVRFIAVRTRYTVTVRRLIKTHLAHKARMPRRRFGQI